MKNKILFISTFANKNASGIFFKQTINFIKKKNKIFVHNFSFKKNLYENLKKFLALYLKTDKNLIIHSQFGSGCGLIGCFLKGKKIISIRGSDILGFRVKEIVPFFRAKLTLSYINCYNKIIVMSDDIKKVLIKNKINRNKIIKLTDPVDPKKFWRMNKNTARKKLNLDLKKKYIFIPFINLTYVEKNYKLIKKILNIFCSHKKYVFLFANNKIKHDKMVYYYNACDCTLIASIYEGWPNAVKESLWCDTPVVTSNVSDLYEISKKTNYLSICKYDEFDFAKKIIYSCNLKRTQNLKNLIKHLNMNNYIKKLNSIYNSM